MDKQIEEMAKLLESKNLNMATWDSYNDDFNDNYPNECKKVATALYNAGYRKIPENAVVLTGTETEERLVDLLVDFDEMSFFPLTTCANPEAYTGEWKRKLIYVIGKLKKETAEKFAERAKAVLVKVYDQYVKNADRNEKAGVRDMWSYWNGEANATQKSIDKIDEICKEITEGKNET